MNMMPEVMRREETMLTPWLIRVGMGQWRAARASKPSFLYSQGIAVIPVNLTVELLREL